MRSIASITIHLVPSRRLLLVQTGAHILAGFAIISAELPGWIAALLLVAFGASLSRIRRPRPFSALVLGGDGILQKVGADGTAIELPLDAGTMVLPQLVVLHWRGTPVTNAGGLALLKDSMPPDDFRRLRVWLRWRATLNKALADETAS